MDRDHPFAFTGGSDGGGPQYGSLIFDASGALYGTTLGGGNTRLAFSTLHAFAGGSDGGSPAYGLIFDASGAIYGTTEIGGEASCPFISVRVPAAAPRIPLRLIASSRVSISSVPTNSIGPTVSALI